MVVSLTADRTSGFPPDLTSIVLTWGAHSFTFPVDGIDAAGGQARVAVTVPNADYSAILNTNCDVTLNYQFRGDSFVGSFTIQGVMNERVGTLNQAVTDIAADQAALAQEKLEKDISTLAQNIDTDGEALNALLPRISPFRNQTVETPDVNALFGDSTGSDPFPTDLTNLSSVSPSNPRFTAGDVAVFVAVIAGASYTLRNITQDTETPLLDSEASVTLGESRTIGNDTYFVFRVTGIAIGNVLEVERVTSERILAWPTDIKNLQDDVQRIDAELEHALLNLPEELVQVLENEVAVTEETTPTVVPTDYNDQLAGPTNTTQTVFYETNPNSPSGGFLDSKPINENSGNDRYRNKLIVVPAGTTFTFNPFLLAHDTTELNTLIEYDQNQFLPMCSSRRYLQEAQAQLFIPHHQISFQVLASGKPSKRLLFQMASLYRKRTNYFLPGTFHRHQPRSQSNTVAMLTETFLAAAQQHSQESAGNEVATTFTLDDGSEVSTVEVRYYPSTRRIRVSVTEVVRVGLPTINDVQVILSFTETRTVPATPATTRMVFIENLHDGPQVFAIKPSSTGTIIIVGDQAEVDTNFSHIPQYLILTNRVFFEQT